MRYDLDQLRDITQGVQEGLAGSLQQMRAAETVTREQEFMLSRQTLRPATESYAEGTLNERAVQGGATFTDTQLNRDGMDFGRITAGTNAEIDDLRRE